MHMDKKKWIKRWKNWLAPTAIQNVWERREGGHFVRARVMDPTTGHLREIKKSLPEASKATAFKWLEDEKARVKSGAVSVQAQKTRFYEFAASLVEHKVKVGDIKSAKGRSKWDDVLTHLIGGTTGEKAKKHVPAFGEFFLDMLQTTHIEAWKAGMADLIAAGDYAPTTINGWLSILRVIMKAAKRQLGLTHLATEGVENFDLSEHETYTEEEPNALSPEEVPAFLVGMRDLYPQHYAMAFLGLVTGLRPSSLRPLRRRGPLADVDWQNGRLLVRRSQTLGDDVMNTTKQRVRYKIQLPPEAVAVLKWHVDTQLATPEQEDSDLLFPSVKGGYRSPCVLNKPFADVAEAVELGKDFTQSGLRRTFNDLARAANVEAIVTRSVSGHLTEKMQDHYSTVNPNEQRAALAKVIRLMTASSPSGAPGGAPGCEGGAPEGRRLSETA
jgi:integrase